MLVFLVLPNPLSIPQTNPSTSAEYAPVPGDTQEANSANFAQTDQATSAGVGAGGEGIGALPGVRPPSLPEFKPRQKNCVGNPPRQTEDPMSPPCVPFFEGKNGGATAPGVTKDEIVVVFANDRCCEGDLTKPWKPSDEGSCMYAFECTNVVRTVKAQLRYFQRRYQTYGREVRVIAQRSTGDVGGECNTREADAKLALQQYKPFAVVHSLGGSAGCYARVMRAAGVPSYGLEWPLHRDEFDRERPYYWGFFPDPETMAGWSATFICQKLVGRTAKFAGDIEYHDDVRKIGFVYPDGDSRGPELREGAEFLVRELDRRCNGYTFDEARPFTASGTGAGSREASTIMSSFKQEGVTTVVCYCIPIPLESTAPTMQRTASGIGYFPEWYWDSFSRYDESFWWKEFGVPEQRSFGSTFLWRNPALREQYHYQAYLQEEPGTTPNTRFNFEFYHQFLNLFQAIQGAGPNLTVESAERGMFTFNYVSRANPFIPTGGYGPYGPDAVSDYNFLDTAMGWWWDPTGTPPGGNRGEGCMRVIRQGQRVFAGQWAETDADLMTPDDPCTQDGRVIADPGGTTQF